jgi:hypothetical protein
VDDFPPNANAPRPVHGRLALLAAFSLALAVPPVAGQTRPAELPFGHKHLVFTIAYRATDAAGSAGDFVALGHYDFLEDHSANLSYFFYDGRKNHRATSTTQRHPRLTPGVQAQPGFVQIPSYTVAEQVRGSWAVDNGLLRVRLGSAVHEWSRRDATEPVFVPRGPYRHAENPSHTLNGWTYGETRGYAYLTDYVNVSRKLTQGDLLPDYKGEIQTLTPARGRASAWEQKASDLHAQRYRPSADGDVLGYATPSRFVSTPTLVFSTLLLNYAPYSRLLLYHNGGHDFNRNGVFDEPGHTMQMFGIFDGSKVARIVYVEYSYQDAGQPILSVGHYYGPGPPAAAQVRP